MSKSNLPKPREPSPRQLEVLAFLAENPGANIQAVADGLGLSHTAAGHLLRLLERKGFVESSRHGRMVRHFKSGAATRGHRLAPMLRDANRSRVLEHLRTVGVGASSINALALRLQLSFGIVKSTLEELEGLGLVRIENVHGRYRVQRTVAFEGAFKPGEGIVSFEAKPAELRAAAADRVVRVEPPIPDA